MPRHVIDFKNAAGQDTPFIVKIDGNRISGEPSGICVSVTDVSLFLYVHSKEFKGTKIII